MRFTKTQTAYALLTVCAFARLFLQMAAMPPYTGLDEVYHVARLAFVRAEHRNPTTSEASIPPYLMRSIANGRNAGVLAGWPAGVPRLRPVDAAMPAMGEAAERWPAIVARGNVVVDQPLTTADLKPYTVKNYEAQQTSIYYSLAARLVPVRSALFELRAWRAMSLLFALITVLATAEIGRRWLGPIGILGGAILVLLPTWETLVLRASNDAFACMLVAIAVLISVSAPKRALGIAAEAIVWGLALNAKMYTWPLLIILPLLWWRQRASKTRVIAVTIVAAIAVVLTFAELSSRTRNPLGIVALDRPGGVVYEAKVNIGEIVRVTVASFAWTSGQHNDALRPIAIALYLVPIFTIAILAVRRRDAAEPAGVTPAFLALAALGAFALAQTYNVVACVLARHGGNDIPIGGKEGWYWYVLAPVIIPALLVPAIKRWRAIAWWIVIWDVIITEGALFPDFAGMTSPAHGSLLFRWGPLHAPFTAHLDDIGVGPLAAWTTAIRIVHLAAFFGLESFLQHMRLNDRNTDVAAAR
ncbi:MAG TPA: hypothetical protein VGQ65_25895 [Thermoanaerobaculia bacterium]|jgi:hypothetical protein|nr:hypothetical protein [Thermoanaerobaculia bacterium]